VKAIGWIGLGKMGQPMAANLLAAGYDLSVYNRSAEKCAPLEADGAAVASDITSLAGRSEAVFSVLSDDAALRQTLLGDRGAIAHMQPGAVLIDMSTVSAAVSAEIASVAAARKVGYLRAPVSGSVAFAAAAKLTVLASGPEDVFHRCLPLLEKLSARQVHVGAADEARIMKLVVNMMVGMSAAMMGEAMALGLKNGLDRATLLEVIGASAVASPLIGYKLDALRARDYTPAFEARMMAKDFDLILEAARASATPLPISAQVREGFSAMSACGDGDADFFKYVELAAHLSGMDTD
jgi:3-hydroxyisobutyrate dehydrogenase-like beta-hydroxyacid dehydrogenase